MPEGGIAMPKCLPGVRSLIIETARKQVLSGGYDAMTLRSVAAECKISTGTIYNYFESKDALVATFMTEEWLDILTYVSETCIHAVSAREAIQCIYESLSSFIFRYSCVIQGFPAANYELLSPNQYHDRLREQLSRLLESVIDRFSRFDNPFLCAFLSDAIIFETQRHCPFSAFYGVIQVYFEEND